MCQLAGHSELATAAAIVVVQTFVDIVASFATRELAADAHCLCSKLDAVAAAAAVVVAAVTDATVAAAAGKIDAAATRRGFRLQQRGSLLMAAVVVAVAQLNTILRLRLIKSRC